MDWIYIARAVLIGWTFVGLLFMVLTQDTPLEDKKRKSLYFICGPVCWLAVLIRKEPICWLAILIRKEPVKSSWSNEFKVIAVAWLLWSMFIFMVSK